VTRISGLIGCACAALALAGAASGSLQVGITEDSGKTIDNGAAFFSSMTDVGLTTNRVSINWDPAHPTDFAQQADIAAWLPQAQTANVRIVFAIAPANARDLTATGDAPGKFVAFVKQVAQALPQVTSFVIGNEPNQPRFWLPQFNSAGRPLSGAAYEQLLAASYDALKAINPSIQVIGVGLSPRGNDQPSAKTNVSRSPVRFLHDMGVAYRASHRTRPLMDELAFHPYPSSSRDPVTKGYQWPNAGIANLDRIKQAVWDAFHGTAQTPFADAARRPFAHPLTLDLDEVGWQVAIPVGLSSFYTGAENVPTTDEGTQARIYGDLVKTLSCDQTVRSLYFFHLGDETDLKNWQSGLVRADGSHRPSYDSVKQAIAGTHGNCFGKPVVWKHTENVVAAAAAWGSLKARPARNVSLSFTAGAGEMASFRAGIFKAGPARGVIGKRLITGRPAAVLRVTGTINAKKRVIQFARRKLKPGTYVFAIRMIASMNSQRSSLLVSKPFRVTAAARRR
jgi:hypothetical protein